MPAGRRPSPVAARLVDEATTERIIPLFNGAAHAEAERAHGVPAIATTAGPVALWTVPTGGGPVCYFVEAVHLSERTGKPVGHSRCTPHPSPNVPIVWARSKIDVDGRSLSVLAGHLAENVGSLWLRSPGGETRRLEIAERFFLGQIPTSASRTRSSCATPPAPRSSVRRSTASRSTP